MVEPQPAASGMPVAADVTDRRVRLARQASGAVTGLCAAVLLAALVAAALTIIARGDLAWRFSCSLRYTR